MYRIRDALLAILLSSVGTGALAWSDHASLLWPMVRAIPELTEPSLRAETLRAFVDSEAEGLQALLAEHEAYARASLPDYPARPDALAFRADAGNTRHAFLRAIRVNPELGYSLYRQGTVDDAQPAENSSTLAFSDLSFLKTGSSHRDVVYHRLQPGALVAPAHVIASGNDEPDFGIDIGLFEDNGTTFGRTYGFGTQPFGNPNLDYGSQAPFHMGFYHLDWLTRTAQPDLLRTMPEWRVSLFGALSKFAFDTGHDYWGWRFAGWALHYVGDLTQPYHAEPLPGIGTIEALWLVVRGETDAAVQLVSNRHGVLESYQFQRVSARLAAQAWQAPILVAISSAGPVPVFSERTMRDVLSLESVAGGDAVDAVLEANVPLRFVSDPNFEWTGSGEESGIVDTVRRENGEGAVAALDAMVVEQMRRFSRYARAWINQAMARAAK